MKITKKIRSILFVILGLSVIGGVVYYFVEYRFDYEYYKKVHEREYQASKTQLDTKILEQLKNDPKLDFDQSLDAEPLVGANVDNFFQDYQEIANYPDFSDSQSRYTITCVDSNRPPNYVAWSYPEKRIVCEKNVVGCGDPSRLLIGCKNHYFIESFDLAVGPILYGPYDYPQDIKEK